MTVKELSQLYKINREIESIDQKIERLRSRAEYRGAQLTGMPRAGGVVDSIGICLAKIDALERLRMAYVQESAIVLRDILAYIDTVEEDYMRQILMYRHVSGLPWRQVAACIGEEATEEGVRKAHDRFLQKRA